MKDIVAAKKTYSLFELNSLIKSALGEAFPDACWVTAEIAEYKCNQKGHCYIDLVEKQNDKTIAQSKATIWAYDHRKLSLKFEKATGETLKSGMKILLLASVTFHELYGLSLTVRDIDPAYTLGEMALKKKEVIERLRKEGIIGLNKELSLPLVPQRIAVISSPTAAGYGDFFNQLDHNVHGYRFSHLLFPASMQGREAEASILAALQEIETKRLDFDIVVIIRGGGSAIDLNCFDSYTLAASAAKFPLPVITGIGHEKDDTVVDIVAHTKMKTPTAVAEFLISGLRSFEDRLLEIQTRIYTNTERFLKDEWHSLKTVIQRLSFVPLRTIASLQHRLLILTRDLKNLSREKIIREDSRIRSVEQALRHLDPANVLRRGYSITRYKGKVLKDASLLKKWAVIETRLDKGTVTSIVQEKKEVKAHGQKQADNLLPGFE